MREYFSIGFTHDLHHFFKQLRHICYSQIPNGMENTVENTFSQLKEITCIIVNL